MSQKIKLELPDPKARGIKESFGVTEARCIELCGKAEEVEKANPKMTVTEVAQEVINNHCKNGEEQVFIAMNIGRMLGFNEGIEAAQMSRAVRSFIDHMVRGERPAKHSFSQS